MAYCKECCSKLEDNAKFCSNCGLKLDLQSNNDTKNIENKVENE